MRIYNTLTRQKEEFKPREPGKAGIYVCGPTVYGYIHVGNARPYVFFAVLARYLRRKGYDVTLVENLTDVDDKIIDRANEDGIAAEEVAQTYAEAYLEDTARLGLERPDIEPKATEHIGEIIELCQRLVEQGIAYETGGSVYYRVCEFPDYGKLSGQKTDQMKHCEMAREGETKESPLDFAIWKAAKPGEPNWESPWGRGRPGWHIECTAMSLKYLGENFDIHGGGHDLVFPHHENEVAQAEAVTGGDFVRYWMHNGMITHKDEKMSKSIGNIFLLREFLKIYDPRVLIIFFMSSHYRSPLEYSIDNLDEAASRLERFRNCFWKLDDLLGDVDGGTLKESGEAEALDNPIAAADKEFEAEMQDDINTAGALAAVFGLVKAINAYTEAAQASGRVSAAALGKAREKLTSLLVVLGVEITAADFGAAENQQKLQELLQAREKARSAGDYAAADAARDKIIAAGYEVRDTPQGPRLVKGG